MKRFMGRPNSPPFIEDMGLGILYLLSTWGWVLQPGAPHHGMRTADTARVPLAHTLVSCVVKALASSSSPGGPEFYALTGTSARGPTSKNPAGTGTRRSGVTSSVSLSSV